MNLETLYLRIRSLNYFLNIRKYGLKSPKINFYSWIAKCVLNSRLMISNIFPFQRSQLGDKSIDFDVRELIFKSTTIDTTTKT